MLDATFRNKTPFSLKPQSCVTKFI